MTTTIDLAVFCEPESPRIATPFVIGQWRYATDGRVCIRLPSSGEPDAPQSERRPKANELFDLRIDGGDWQAWPVLPQCKQCDGAGHAVVKCERCHGSGNCVCDSCETEHDCGHCDGAGEADDNCLCRTEWHEIRPYVNLSRHYLTLIGSLPGVELYSLSKVGEAVHFRFEGGEGAVMPRID